MAKVDKIWFQDRIRDRKLSQRRLAFLMDMDPAAMSLMLSGRRRMSTEETNIMARHLGVSVQEVMEHAGIRPHKIKTVPAKFGVSGGGVLKRLKKQEKLEAPDGVPNCIGIVCDDKSSPYYKWELYYVERKAVGADCIGYLCVVDDKHIGRVHPGNKRGVYNLVYIDGTTVEDLDILNASPVILIKT